MLAGYASEGDNNAAGSSSQPSYNKSATSNLPFLSQHQLSISRGSVDGYKSVDAATLNGLHNFIYRIFSLYDKLQLFIQLNAQTGRFRQEDAAQEKHINEIFEQWYSLGMSLKDRLVAVNSFPELSLTLAAFQPKQIAKLWRLSRLLRTFVWARKGQLTSAATASSNDGLARFVPREQSSSDTRANYGSKYSYFAK